MASLHLLNLWKCPQQAKMGATKKNRPVSKDMEVWEREFKVREGFSLRIDESHVRNVLQVLAGEAASHSTPYHHHPLFWCAHLSPAPTINFNLSLSTPNKLIASCSSPEKFTKVFNEVPTKPVVRQTSTAMIHQNLPKVCISEISHAISCWHGMAKRPSGSDIRIAKIRYLEEEKKQRNVSKLRPEPLNSTIILGKQ